jgi:hypothetical protein
MDATMKTAQDRYGGQIEAALAEMRTILAGRSPCALQGDDALRFMAAQMRFDQVAVAQKHFAEADLASRLDPAEGSETVDA